jgi:carbon-monoxide dehydrogenase medium subunit
MKPAPFRYARPETLEEAIALLEASEGEAKILAGGQSLLPLLNLRLLRPRVLVDVALVPELQVLTREEDELVVGAGVRQRRAETSALVRRWCPLVPLALRHVGRLQTRCRGTVGGSLAHGDPAAELPCVAVALDAELVAVGPAGRRTVSARDFFGGPYQTTLAVGEVLTEVRLPILRQTRYVFREVARRPGDVAVAGLAVAVRHDGGAIVDARLAAIGLAAVPLRLAAAEDALREHGLGRSNRAPVVAAAVEELATAGDGRPAGYRRGVIAALVARALDEVAT